LAALIVQLSTVGSYESEYYDPLSGITLTPASPNSSDLSGLPASRLINVAGAVAAGRLNLISGVLPSLTPVNDLIATNETTVLAGTANTIKPAAGYLFSVIVTTTGSAPLQILDGTTVVAEIPGNQPLGDVPIYGTPRPFFTSLSVAATTNGPAITVLWT
jgi:hypothetical protein